MGLNVAISSAGEIRIAPLRPMPGALLQRPHQPADAIAAVALAGDEDGRPPATVAGQPAPHELAQGLEVTLVSEVLLGIGGIVFLFLGVFWFLVLDDAAETRSDRIDEHEVA